VPSDLTIFVAGYLVFIEALLAAAILVPILFSRPRTEWVRWAALTAIMVVLAYVFAKIGGIVYSDPRPFVTDHVRPLIAHAPDNGFPSDHALLAAALVAAVAFVRPLLALPVAAVAILVDWARVGAGLHHVADVAGSTLFVALGAAIALVVGHAIVGVIMPYLPGWLVRPPPVPGRGSA
jgi:membrane-associated phospholipid phosphatase